MTQLLPSKDWIESISCYENKIPSLNKEALKTFCVVLSDQRVIQVSQHQEPNNHYPLVRILFLPLLSTQAYLYPGKIFLEDLLQWLGIRNKKVDDFTFSLFSSTVQGTVETSEKTTLVDQQGFHGIMIVDPDSFLFTKLSEEFDNPVNAFQSLFDDTVEKPFLDEYFTVPDTPIVHKQSNHCYIVEFPKSVLVVEVITVDNKPSLTFDCFIQKNPQDVHRRRILLSINVLLMILNNIYVKGVLFNCSQELGYTEDGKLFTVPDSKLLIATKKRLNNINTRQFNTFKTARQKMDVELHLAKKATNPFAQLGVALRGKLKKSPPKR